MIVNNEKLVQHIVGWLKNYSKDANKNCLVVELSENIDSESLAAVFVIKDNSCEHKYYYNDRKIFAFYKIHYLQLNFFNEHRPADNSSW